MPCKRRQPKLAVFPLYPLRARYVIRDFIRVDCQAGITSDRYSAYPFFEPARRQVCRAHLLRDFNRIALRQGRLGASDIGCWAWGW